MRVALAALALLAAGCLSPAPAADELPPPADAPVVYAPDCSLGAGWDQPCVSRASPNDSPSQTEIDVVVNPTDPMNVVASSKDNDPAASDCVWAVPQVSKDGGRTWTSVILGGPPASRAPTHPLFGWHCITDPIMAFDQDGTLYYSLQIYDRGARSPIAGASLGSAILLATSKDGGLTWPTIITLHAGDGTGIFHDYMRMATSPKTQSVFTVWNQFQAGRAPVPVIVASRDGGDTAGAPVYLPVPEPRLSVARGLATTSDGGVHVLIQAGASVYIASSRDDGMTFATPVKAFEMDPFGSIPNVKFRAGTFPELAADTSGGERDGCLYAVWADGGAGEGDADILARSSCDGAKTWSDPVRVNRDTTKSDQWMPRVVVGDHGTVHVAYMTRAYDANNTLVDAEYAYSTDGGLTWANKRLTARGSDGDKGIHQDGARPFFGDYIGIASAGDRTYAGFPVVFQDVAEIGVSAIVRSA